MRHRPSVRTGLRVALTAMLVACVTASLNGSADAAENEALWQSLRTGEAVAVMRHAIAPGTGDPAEFDLGDCATQRNLSEDGRRQSIAIGNRFREHGIREATVMASAWCRAQETAALLDLGPVGTLEPLNSFFGNAERGEPQTEALGLWLEAHETVRPLVLVTHQVNITALTGVYPRSGEIVVLRREPHGDIVVLGRL